MSEILRVDSLNKKFGNLVAVDNLSFSVKKGDLFAFLGQNGAGKSTTINMLIGTLEKDGGEIIYSENKTFKEFKDKIGVVFQNNIFDDSLTVEENIKLYGRLYLNDRQSINQRYDMLAKLFDFKEFEKKLFKNLSGGQKRRVEVARALFNQPEILFLDEPTTGLDPRTRIEVWDIINKIRLEKGMTVFLTTHYMEETSEANQVVIIHKGRKIAVGSPSELKERYSNDKIRIVPLNSQKFEKLIADLHYTKVSDYYEFISKKPSEEIDLLNRLKNEIKYFEVIRGSMDDVFLNAVSYCQKEEGNQ